jgi:hypothetical protein
MHGDTVKKLDQRHEHSAKMLPTWTKCTDAREGQTAIHAAGKTYLPRLSGQSDAEFKAYVRRACFYGAFSRTVDAFQGMVMRVAPSIDQPSPLLDDVTGQGESLSEFIDDVLEDALVTGFGGVLVEHAPMVEALTLAQAQALGSRPYLAHFDAMSIINWRQEKKRFTQVVLEEREYIDKSEFEQEAVCVYRVLDLDDAGYYRQRKFVKSDKQAGDFTQEGDDIYPLKNGVKLSEIPFYVIGQAERLPPLIDLVDLNISHYMTTADLENGAHYTGLPQPWTAGVQLPDGETLSVGGISAWVFPDPQASAQYLEFTGQGLGALEKRLELKEKQMAALGAKMLSDSVVAETATAAGLRSSGEFSVLAQLAGQLGKIMSRACSFMHDWAGLGPVDIKLNTDYLPQTMTAQELQAIVAAWQAGAISSNTLFYNLKQGEIIGQDVEFEDEQTMIAESAPVLMPQPQDNAAA